MGLPVLGGALPPFTSRLQNFRLSWGSLEVASPELVARMLRLGRPLDRSERIGLRVLGSRQVAQGIASQVRPSPETTRLGFRIDALHAASMLALAVVSKRHRRLALVSGGIAAGLAGAAWLSLPAHEG